MHRLTKILILFVIVFHVLVFIAEVFLWMQPGVYGVGIIRLGTSSTLSPYEQALVLKNVFINQGFYNLFLALGGIAGLVFHARGNRVVGNALIAYMCFFAIGAGLVLAFTTTAYVGAVLQAVPAGVALLLLSRTS